MAFTSFLRLIAAGDVDEVDRRLAAAPALASMTARIRVTRDGPGELFLKDIAHYVYGGDTALHVAAAAFQRPIAELLVARGADVRARNRRGAEPLHYAADTNYWNPDAQADVIDFLVSAGADPNARDQDGTAPLHRAVRTRSLPAVRALVAGGASPTAPNGRGSTPMHLAVHNTGRGGSGSPLAREQQAGIVRFLDLVVTLERLISLLERYGDSWWSSWLTADLGRIRAGGLDGAAHLLTAYGGMGSFTDLILHPRNGHSIGEDAVEGVNLELSDLRSRAWTLATELLEMTDGR